MGTQPNSIKADPGAIFAYPIYYFFSAGEIMSSPVHPLEGISVYTRTYILHWVNISSEETRIAYARIKIDFICGEEIKKSKQN